MEQFTVSCSEPSGSAYTQPTRSWRRADTRPLTVTPVPGRVNSQPSGVSATLVARAFPMPPIPVAPTVEGEGTVRDPRRQ